MFRGTADSHAETSAIMSYIPHGQKYQPPAAGVSSANCWLRPDLCHNLQRQEELPPEKQMHRTLSSSSVHLCVGVFTHVSRKLILTSESQKSKSLMPVLKFCCLLASLSFWLFSADLLTRNCHCSSRALRRAWEHIIVVKIQSSACLETLKFKSQLLWYESSLLLKSNFNIKTIHCSAPSCRILSILSRYNEIQQQKVHIII